MASRRESGSLRGAVSQAPPTARAGITTAIATFSGPVTVTFWLGLVTGVISAYSSSSGVVMPAFLPARRQS